jgi:hypothetical protein
MMIRGAKRQWLTPEDTDLVPDGYFWCEEFSGDHISVDYHWGQQDLTVQGFRSNDRLDRFSQWNKIDTCIPLPNVLSAIAIKYEWINVEYVDGNPIEVHARYNDDFRNHSGDIIIPVWKDENVSTPKDSTWYSSPSGDRLGFFVSNRK